MFICNDAPTQQCIVIIFFLTSNIKTFLIYNIVVYHYQLDKIDKIKHEQCYITYDMITFVIVRLDRKYKVIRIYHFNYNSNFNPVI